MLGWVLTINFLLWPFDWLLYHSWLRERLTTAKVCVSVVGYLRKWFPFGFFFQFSFCRPFCGEYFLCNGATWGPCTPFLTGTNGGPCSSTFTVVGFSSGCNLSTSTHSGGGTNGCPCSFSLTGTDGCPCSRWFITNSTQLGPARTENVNTPMGQ